MKTDIVKKNWFALVIFILISLVVVSPIFKNITYWGTNDWDQHFFYYESARKSIIEYKQFPFWNPWYCGGNALLAHPESSFLYPLFIINLLFGTVVGLKIQIFLHLIIGKTEEIVQSLSLLSIFQTRVIIPFSIPSSAGFNDHTRTLGSETVNKENSEPYDPCFPVILPDISGF